MFINKKKYKEIGGFDNNFFLYFEETDYCKRALKKNLNAYQINRVKVKTEGKTVSIENENEKGKLINLLIWHFIWSKFYFMQKNYGKLISIIYFIPTLIRIIFKIILYKIFKKKAYKEKYMFRLSGLVASIRNKKSSLRI